jgi:hypothetical protein
MPETMPTPAEQRPERALEQPPVPLDKPSKLVEEAAIDEVSRPADALVPEVLEFSKDERLMAVEKIMEARLKEVFKGMPERTRLAFKREGEALALEIRRALERPKLNAVNVLKKELRWLEMIPKANRHFVLQEAACKTQAIVRLHEEIREQASLGSV